MADKNVKASKAAKPAKNILRVTDPNAKELGMYKDSVLATGRAIESNKFIERLDKMPMDKRRTEVLKGFKPGAGSGAAIARLEKANKQPYKEGKSSTRTILEAPEGYGYNEKKGGKTLFKENPGVTTKTSEVSGLNVLAPKRKVIYEPPPPPKPEPKAAEPAPKPKEIERLEPRTASTKISTPEREIVAPVLRPIPKKEPVKEKNIGMGASLRYPSQGLLSKIKRRITGEPNAAYWVDKEGTKRYPSRGENNPQAVREKEMLTKGLNPRNSDDKATLDKVDTYFKKSAK